MFEKIMSVLCVYLFNCIKESRTLEIHHPIRSWSWGLSNDLIALFLVRFLFHLMVFTIN